MLRIVVFGIIGAGVGLLWWRLVGCSTGQCPLTSNWVSSVLVFALLGALLGSAGAGGSFFGSKHTAKTTEANVRYLTSSDFDEAINSDKPILVDFYADWCAPCRMQAPVLEQIASEWQGRAEVAKVDVDAAPELAQRFGIRGIPTLIVFRAGRVVRQLVGLQSRASLEAALNEALAASSK